MVDRTARTVSLKKLALVLVATVLTLYAAGLILKDLYLAAVLVCVFMGIATTEFPSGRVKFKVGILVILAGAFLWSIPDPV